MHDMPQQNEDYPVPQLRKIRQEELDKIIKWLGVVRETPSGQEVLDDRGQYIEQDLSHVDLRGLDFNQADLRGAVFMGSDLRDALLHNCRLEECNLIETDLRGAMLAGADLKGANLFGANLENASLYGADLSGADVGGAYFWGAELAEVKMADVKGLKADALAGAVVTGADLPGDVIDFSGLKYISSAASSAAKLFTALLTACLYCWITLGGLLVGGEAAKKVKLPIANIDIPLEGFLFLAPVILLALFVYMHLYLQNIWEAMAVMPAVFTDGTELNKKAGPWLPLGFARSFSPRLRNTRGPIAKINYVLTLVLLWMITPLTIMAFILIDVTYGLAINLMQGALIILATFAAMFFHYQAAATLTLYSMKKGAYVERFLPGNAMDHSGRILRKGLLLFNVIFLGLMILVFLLDFLPN